MWRLPKLLLACLAVVLLTPAAAYADQTQEANRLVDQVNALLPQDSRQYSELQDLLAKADQIDPASKKAGDALQILAEARALLDEMISRMQSVAALTDKAAALELRPEFKAYLTQRKELARLNLQLYGLWGDLVGKYQLGYLRWKKLSASQRTMLGTDIADLINQIDSLAAKTQEKETASNKYYADNKIGEASAESGTRIPPIVWLAGIGFGSYLVGRWYRRRRLRRAVPELYRGDGGEPGAGPVDGQSEPPGIA